MAAEELDEWLAPTEKDRVAERVRAVGDLLVSMYAKTSSEPRKQLLHKKAIELADVVIDSLKPPAQAAAPAVAEITTFLGKKKGG